ncbi:Glutamyl-tRNA(Gln) amidotransferase subunit B, mitochondrial [Dufourea novaeangliae]|uniref:Glutamyl-tRNA(Gln) amidotransferase subunit B, mitochondrial n=2 Tax=Dufourea novaeangliae TaxID=178035 RepID=A0A154P8Z3_DUFNO|nr:Glutamyl-tRNA(Gln) amidotransferase subunit B, mitochondrial [Dufourea novaeangliae]
MPVLNKKCVEAGVLTALALSCKMNDVSMFERKHYFYCDLPAGFQITQHKKPLAMDGKIKFMVFNPSIHKKAYLKSSTIKQIQLEQDSGRTFHNELLGKNLIDLNRAGLPLMELVFEPDLTDGEEAAALVKELVLILKLLDTCSCKMEEGALRVDANVSVSKDNTLLGTRTEIKNIGSTRAVCNAIQYEIERQISVLESGGRIVTETRAWDPIMKKTLAMREKEDNHDYRFMPEPNLLPLRLHVDGAKENKYNLIDVSSIEKQLPELPEKIRQILMEDFAITPNMTVAIMNDLEILQLFRDLVSKNKNRDPQLVARVFVTILFGFLKNNNLDFTFLVNNRNYIGQLIDLLQDKVINYNIAGKILNVRLEQPKKEPKQIVEENNWFMITDEKELEKLCLDILNKNPKLVAKYKRGKTKVFNQFMRAAVVATNECADMVQLTQIFTKLLN